MQLKINPISSRMPADGWCIHFAALPDEPEIMAGPLTGSAYDEKSRRLVLLSDAAHLRSEDAFNRAAEILKKWNSGSLISQLWQELDGAGTLMLWDAPKRLLYLGVDRLGGGMGAVRRYGESLTLANTLTAPQLSDDTEISAQAIHDYLSLQYLPEGTVFTTVSRLKGGRFLCLDLAHRQEYKEQWDAERFQMDDALTEEEAVSQLRRRVTAAVRKLLDEGGERTALLLSGGVDSAIVSGVAASLAQRKLKAYTAGFQEAAYDERGRAEASAALIGQVTGYFPDHRHLEITADDWPLLAAILRSYGEPYGDASLLATAKLLHGAADDGAELLLSGDAADEFFGGYERYRFMKLTRCMPPLPGISVFTRILPDGGERTGAGRFKRLVPALARSGLGRYLQLLDRFPEADKKAVYGPRMLEKSRFLRPTRRLAELSGSEPPGIAAYQQWDMEHYMPGDVLVKTALAAASAGVPVRSPFPDREVMELALRLPEELKIQGNRRKYLLARAFPEFVPPALAHRSKTGFGVPVSAWLRGPWQKLLQENLLEGFLVREQYFRRAVVEKWVTEHLQKKCDRSYALWSLLTLEISLADRQNR